MKYPENIQKVAALHPDYMGFIFYPKSPRYVLPADSSLFEDVPSEIKKIGVFVNEDLEGILKQVFVYKLNGVQLHGAEMDTLCAQLKEAGLIVLKAFSIDDSFHFGYTRKYEGHVDYFLFDTKTSAFGGSGMKFDWSKLKEYKGKTPFLLSGGITRDDAEAILEIDHPCFAGIDLNSKFELSPGLKNAYDLKEFLSKLKQSK